MFVGESFFRGKKSNFNHYLLDTFKSFVANRFKEKNS